MGEGCGWLARSLPLALHGRAAPKLCCPTRRTGLRALLLCHMLTVSPTCDQAWSQQCHVSNVHPGKVGQRSPFLASGYRHIDRLAWQRQRSSFRLQHVSARRCLTSSKFQSISCASGCSAVAVLMRFRSAPIFLLAALNPSKCGTTNPG